MINIDSSLDCYVKSIGSPLPKMKATIRTIVSNDVIECIIDEDHGFRKSSLIEFSFNHMTVTFLAKPFSIKGRVVTCNIVQVSK